jgi:hypothetical protein
MRDGILSHKQKWRRSKPLRHSSSSSSISSSPSSSFSSRSSSSTTAESHTSSSSTAATSKNMKIVRFNEKLRVILVPCCHDYRSHGLNTEVWWQPTDFIYFKNEARDEVLEIMEGYNVDTITAMNYLFTSCPSPEDSPVPPPPPPPPLSEDENWTMRMTMSDTSHAGDQSPSTITRRPSFQFYQQQDSLEQEERHNFPLHLPQEAKAIGPDHKSINFLDLRTKGSSHSHEVKPIHPLALLAD